MKEESDQAEGAESAKARGESGLARSGHWKGEPSGWWCVYIKHRLAPKMLNVC